MALSLIKRTSRPDWLSPISRDPWGELFFDRLWPDFTRDLTEEWVPSMDFVEKGGKYHLTAEVPGMKKDDIQISVHDGIVTIEGKKESSNEEKGSRYYIKETRVGSFTRSFRLPEDASSEKIDATYKDGILNVVFEKKEGSEKRKIEVH